MMNVYRRIHGQDGSGHLVASVFLWLSLAGQEQEEEEQNIFFPGVTKRDYGPKCGGLH